MATSKAYWANRVAKQMHAHQQSADEMLKDLMRYYIASSLYMQSEAEKILKKFQTKHHLSRSEAEKLLKSVKNPSDINALITALKKDPKNAQLAAELESQAYAARIRRLAVLHDQVDTITIGLAATQGSKGMKMILQIAKDAYYRKIYDLQQYVGAAWKFKMLDEKNIRNVLDRSWAGSKFSQRIWGNTKKLEEAVKRELAIAVMTGRPIRQTALAIDEEFQKGYNNAKRLIRTETTYVTNQMHKQAYEASDVDKYIYVATLDLRTSKVCRSLDGKTFKLKDAQVGVNYPPMHPWCRSVTIGWLPDKWLAKMKRRAWNPETGRTVLVPANMTYQQWYDKFVNGEDNTKYLGIENEDFNPFVDVTGEWRPEELSEEDYDELTEYMHEGKLYKVDGQNVIQKHREHEKELAKMMSRWTGKPARMVPEITGKYKKKKTPDLMLGDDAWEEKRTKCTGKDPLRNEMDRRKADRYIFDVTPREVPIEKILKDAENVFNQPNVSYVKEVVIVENNRVVKALRRK